ncbi:DUF4926 domain-containing protein [Cupriavidus sp. BIS7]|uniref:DUF4926 domain-containing protein n=1 Tax=Cupriavidus sp. BIS7 TaxID=1217718 RepID=UPI000A001E77|nr:DUF4926 domain-containing protein [Cupriavidus sp. BIS7]
MNEFELFDVVALIDDLLDDGLRAGMKGVIVEIHHSPCLAYEVEFCDEQGKALALVALLPTQVKRVWVRRY